ncbi:MAG: hypothetical protein IJ829_03570, partial [Kiritimatiellae bacterium]|nr:hypothetical protein [Kiritimatiellia bacterium]
MAAAAFVSEVPETLRARLASTNEVGGVFVQTKTTGDGRRYVTRGDYELRPGRDFVWRTREPFEACFSATPTAYVYSNEDETVSRPLADLPGFSKFAAVADGDFAAFFRAFDVMYAEEGGRFYLRAKPKVADLRRVLAKVDAEGTVTNWVLRAELADKTVFSLEFADRAPAPRAPSARAKERGEVQLWAGGPCWATTNIGAASPEDFGLYFWWGDTVGYRRENDALVAADGSSSCFSFSEGNAPTCGKNNDTLLSEGWVVSKGGTYVLAPEHDAAQAHWGGGWRMPTDRELSDLSNKCDWTWEPRNGVNGYVVRGKGDYASASIFLPAAGLGYGTSL